MKRTNPEKFKHEIGKIGRQLRAITLFSTITIPSSYQGDPKKFDGIYRFLLETTGIDAKSLVIKKATVSKHIDRKFGEFTNHFGEDGEQFLDTLSYKVKLGPRRNRITLRIWGPVRFETDADGNFIAVMPSLGSEESNTLCPAMKVSFFDGEVWADNLTVRTDGEITFSTPACIASPAGFLNVDKVQDKKEIYQRLRSGIEAVKLANLQAMRFKAELEKKGKLGFCKVDPEYPTEEGKELVCPSCPFNISCNSCFTRTEEDSDVYYQALKDIEESK